VSLRMVLCFAKVQTSQALMTVNNGRGSRDP